MLGKKARHIDPTTHPSSGHIFRHSIARFLKQKGFSVEWIQNFLSHQSYQTIMDMYGTISIDEMQEIAEQKLRD